MTNEELEATLRRVLSDVKNADERQTIVDHLFGYTNTMEVVQKLPTAIRLKYFVCTRFVYDYLRSNGQLGREPGLFETGIRCGLTDVLRSLKIEVPLTKVRV